MNDDTNARRKRRRVVTEGESSTEVGNGAAYVDTSAPTVQDSPKEENQQSRSLFVRSLPSTTTTQTLTAHFSHSYPLKHATVVIDSTTKQSKGYGFITFADVEDAQRAKEEFNGSILEGRKIGVEIAEPRNRHPDKDGINGRKTSQPVVRAIESKAERERLRSENQKPPKLIIRNLPWSIKDSEQLASLFRSYGKIKYATIPKPREGLSAGFGFVTLRGKKNAEKALAGVNGKTIDGRTLAVDWAVEKDVWQTLQEEDGDVNEVKADLEGPGSQSEQDDTSTIKTEDEEGIRHDEDALSDADHETPSNDEDDNDVHGDDESKIAQSSAQDKDTTLFIRNLPFNTTDETLLEHFRSFGPVKYARVVLDTITGRSKGTGFVCFFTPEDTIATLREAPKLQSVLPLMNSSKASHNTMLVKHSVLEDVQSDPTGRYTLEGRVLHVAKAVDRNEASRLAGQGSSIRDARDRDKRRFFLLSEGTIPAGSPLHSTLAPSEVKMREDSVKQRQSLMKNNPSLHLSLTRLSIRNIPRSITSKDLKALAREAVVGFASDVKAGIRRQLSKEEISRGGDEMRDAEKARKAKGKGIVKQAKIVFEGREGGKVTEESGAGRSRGYGFIEYVSHRWALMGLRWLNGHAVGQPKSRDEARKALDERKKRLIVEFAIENAQVVARRQDREVKAREVSKSTMEKKQNGEMPLTTKTKMDNDASTVQPRRLMKRKREADVARGPKSGNRITNDSYTLDRTQSSDKTAKRQQIIGRKRMLRKAKKATRGVGKR